MDFTNSFDFINELAENAIRINNRDYEKDGLLYCGKCNTPKQHILRNGTKVNCLCKCGVERRDAEQQERAKQARKEYIERLRKVGFPDYEMQFWTFDKDDGANEELSRMARRYASNFPQMLSMKKGLLLYGTVGTGKTFISACIANALTDKGYPCLVTNFARLCRTVTGMYDGKQKYIDSLNGFDLLVIDDLASERDTEYMHEIVQDIVDSRYRCGKPMIVTTNLTAEELMNPSDIKKQRLYSRLFEMCLPYEVKGTDRRKAKAKDDRDEMKRLLGL